MLAYWLDSEKVDIAQTGGVLELSGVANRTSVRLQGDAILIAPATGLSMCGLKAQMQAGVLYSLHRALC